MAYPAIPINGQVYTNKKYNSIKGVWEEQENSVIRVSGGNVLIGTSMDQGRVNISAGETAETPALGLGSNANCLTFSDSTGALFGSRLGLLTNGNTYLQSTRLDGTATAYNVMINPLGGNVLIGTTTDGSAKLFVSGGDATGIMSSTVARFNGAENGIAIGSDATDGLIGVNNSDTTLWLLSRSAGVYSKSLGVTGSGNVLIGTTTDNGQNTLQVSGTASISNIAGATLSLAKSSGHGSISLGSASTAYALIESVNNGGLDFYTGNGSPIRRVRIASNGNVAIGNASDSGATLTAERAVAAGEPIFRIHNEQPATESFMRIRATVIGSSYSHGDIVLSPGASTDQGSIGFRMPYSAGYVGLTLNHNGTVNINNLSGAGNRAVYSDPYGGLTNTASDRSLKKNIENSTYGLADTLKLRPVSYNWIDENKMGSQKEIGFIAQEVQDVVPEVVGVNNDGTLSLDYPKLVAVLVNSIKELEERIKILENK